MNELEKETIFGIVNVLMKLLDLDGKEPAPFAGATAGSAEPARALIPAVTEENGKMALLFTEKEIIKMPKEFRKLFRTHKATAHVRRRENGVYEVRCQINKQPITGTGKRLSDAKAKFIKKLCAIQAAQAAHVAPELPEEPTQPEEILLLDYMEEWLETCKKPFIKASTYKCYTQIFNADITPRFEGRAIDSVKSFELQAFFNEYAEAEKYRTAQKIYQLLGAMFNYAVADEVLVRSPMAKVKILRYEQERGVPLNRTEERDFVNAFQAAPTVYHQAFVFMLYTGIRRSELASVNVSDGWVHLITSKQRKGFKEKRRSVPVSPMLAAVLPLIDVESIVKVSPGVLTKRFKDLCPAHHLHDLRHTFITRAQECGIRRELVSLWAGHAPDNSTTSLVYTHLGQEKSHQIAEIQKFFYETP